MSLSYAIVLFEILSLALNVIAQNQLPQQGRHPYYGKYLGMLTSDQYILGGVVWAASDSQILITDFTFQPPLFQLTNMTFVIGPNLNSGSRQYDLIPNANGSHLDPVTTKFELIKVYKTITAKQPTAKETSEISLSGGKRVKFNPCGGNYSEDSNHTRSHIGAAPEPEPFGRPISNRADSTPEKHSDHNDLQTSTNTGTTTPQNLPKVTQNSNILVVNDLDDKKAGTTPISLSSPSEFLKKIWKRSVRLSSNEVDKFIWRGELVTRERPNEVINQLVTARQNCADGPIHSVQQSREEVVDTKSLVSSKPNVIKDLSHLGGLDKPTERPFFLITAASLGDATTLQSPTAVTAGTSPPSSTVSQRDITNTKANETIRDDHSINGSAVLKPIINDKEVHKDLEKIINATTSASESNHSSGLEPLSFHYHSSILLTLPPNRTITDYKWLALWDNFRDNSISTIFLPNGPSFSPPKPVLVKGLTPATSFKDVRSGLIEILDVKTIRIRDFYFEGDAPGAWFMVGQSVIPNALSGTVVPVLKSDGRFDCDFLQPSCNQTITLKLPGNLEVSDVFWISVFCVPYSISFATRYLPYQDITVPADTSQSDIPNCQLK